MSKPAIGRRWLPLNALRAFEGVAKHGSFTVAANTLLISQSALSRHVIALETLIGAQLFERRPHSLVLTQAGAHLLPAVIKSFDRLEYALDDIRNEGTPTQRTLRVQMPPSFAVQLAVPILRDFRRASSEVEIDLVSPSAVGPPLSDVDVAVIYSKPTVTHMIADLLWPVRLNAVPSAARREIRRQGPADFPGRERIDPRAPRRPAAPPPVGAVHAPGRHQLGQLRARPGVRHRDAGGAVRAERRGRRAGRREPVQRGDPRRPAGAPVRGTLDDGYGYYLITHPEALSDTAIALFRSWLIERFGKTAPPADAALRLAVSNE
jgi:DNA-binding transcriptional LysR family regulator